MEIIFLYSLILSLTQYTGKQWNYTLHEFSWLYFELKGGRKKQGTYTYTSTECISFRYLHVMCLNESNDDNDHYTQKANLSSLIHTLGRVL